MKKTMILLFSFIFIQCSNDVKFVVQDIESTFSGTIVEKYSVREGVGATFLKIKTSNNFIEINPSFLIVDYCQIGDSIIKLKNENICYIIKKNGVKKKFYYVSISLKQRENSNFPIKWKNKWMGSTTILDSVYPLNKY